MNEGMRSIVEEARWPIAILVSMLVPVLGMGAGLALTSILVAWLYGSDVDAAMNLVVMGPIGALTGLGAGALLSSRVVRWARDAEAHR
jgi:hypothetical protein